jgi:hypothetical protein
MQLIGDGSAQVRRISFSCRPSLALLFFALFVFSTEGARGETHSPLLLLYNALLAGTNSEGCVTFERQIVVPARGRSGSTNTPKLPPPDAAYVTFLWDGAKYLVAYSRRTPTEERSISSAERLYGFDGTNYWRLLKSVSTTYLNEGGQSQILAPVDVQSQLTVISTEEASNALDRYVANPTLTTINEFAAECRRVVQLGFSFHLTQAPTWLNSNSFSIVSAGHGSQIVTVTGDAGSPDTITYSDSSNTLPKFKATVGFSENALVIDRLSSVTFRPFATIKYRVLSVRIPNTSAPSTAYSWQTYRADAGNVVAEVAKNGATVRGAFKDDGTLEPQNKVLAPAKPLPESRKAPTVILWVLGVTSFVPLVLIFLFKWRQKT